jgi:hypothetical protein
MKTNIHHTKTRENNWAYHFFVLNVFTIIMILANLYKLYMGYLK